MKRIAHLTAGGLLTLFVASAIAETPNLVPEKPVASPHYWCTWYAQNYWIERGGEISDLAEITNPAAREEMTYHNLFNPEDGWASTYLPRGREDYIFLIDHGWQSKAEDEFVGGGIMFFNSVADERDFPPYKELSPPKRLKKFNEEIQAKGWGSLGLWFRGNVEEQDVRKFVEWSKYAGITYWKVDGGDISKFFTFNAKEEIYPELIVEYATPAGNLNPNWSLDLPSYPSPYVPGGRLNLSVLRVLQNSDVFRTYDSPPLLMTSVSVRRLHDILRQTQQQPGYRSLINIQDDCNAAIGLGVLVASKRHPNMGERLLDGKDLHHQLSGPRMMQKRINEAERLGRWSRIAPAFSAGEGTYLSSDDELVDRCVFTKWDTWNQATYGKTVSQSAPAIMARNMPLPEVECSGIRPFVFASTYPNGPTGIATEGRVTPENKWVEPRAKVSVRIKDASQPIGIAGRYEQLTLEFAGSLESVRHIWAQDLLADRSVDIREKVTILGNTLTLSGSLIDQIGTSAGDEGDISVPGMVLQLEGKNLPLAGADFTPVTAPITQVENIELDVATYADGFFGEAQLEKDPFGYRVTAGEQQVVLKKLDEVINSGTFSVSWKMKPADASATNNGFLVLSSDAYADAALFSGSWSEDKEKIHIFESRPRWTSWSAKAIAGRQKELHFQLDVDIDLRTAVLTVNGERFEHAFTESFVSIAYIGFGVTEASSVFSKPVIK